MVAAGAIVPANTVVKSNQIWAGSPAVYLRDLKAGEREAIADSLHELRDLSGLLAQESNRTSREQLKAKDNREYRKMMLPEDYFKQFVDQHSFLADRVSDDFGVEGAIEGFGEYGQEDMAVHTAKDDMTDDVTLDEKLENLYSKHPESDYINSV